MIFESLSSILKEDVLEKLETMEGKAELLEQIDKALAEIGGKLEELASRPQPDYEEIAETVKEKVVEAIPAAEEIDYDKITESVSEKTETSLSQRNKEILDAVAAIPVAENVDYARIVEEVSDKVLEKLHECRRAKRRQKPKRPSPRPQRKSITIRLFTGRPKRLWNPCLIPTKWITAA